MIEPPTIRNFFRAFAGHWFTLMSGPLTVPFAIAALIAPQTWQKALSATLAIMCAIVTCYLIWARERKLRNEAEQRLGRPEPVVTFDNFNIAGFNPFIIVNNSDQVAVHIQAQDIEYAGKKLRFHPLDFLRQGNTARMLHCYVEGVQTPAGQQINLRDFFDAGWDGQQNESQPFHFRATYLNVDNAEPRRTWELTFDFRYNYRDKKIEMGPQGIKEIAVMRQLNA